MSPAKSPQPMTAPGARIAAAFAVAALVSAACLGAAQESRRAVQESSAAMARTTQYVTLPAVEVVVRREAAGAIAADTRQRAAQAL